MQRGGFRESGLFVQVGSIFSMTAGSSRQLLPALPYLLHPCSRMQAIILAAPPQWLHVSMSILKTRFKRCAEVLAACPVAAVLSVSSPVRRPRSPGITCARVAVRCKNAVTAHEVHARFWYQCRQPCDEIQRLGPSIWAAPYFNRLSIGCRWMGSGPR